VHKSDVHDVVSIAEAALRPNIHFVPVKSIAQQDLQLLGRIRGRLVTQRTAIINQIRGLAREYGVNFAKSREALLAQLPDALADAENDLSPIAREELAKLLQDVRRITDEHVQIMRRITALASEDPAYERLRTIPGIGPTIAPALLASMGHAQQFASARQCSAWAGLVPRQNSTGGRVQLGGITKNGDRSLRVLLIHGARTVVRWADKHAHPQSRWIRELVARRGKNKAVVALANKLMRIVWVVLTRGVEYDMRKAFRAQPVA
jgi:transposase